MEKYHIYPWEVIVFIALVAFVIYFRKQQGRQAAASVARKAKETPAETFMRLRQEAIETPAASLALPGELKPSEPYGILMEMGIPNSVVTLACFANGDARLYYKTGGGMVGGISHEKVRKAAQEFSSLARKALPRMSRVTSYPVPHEDRVRFYVLTPRGIFTTETDREALGEPGNELAPLFYSGQEVVTQMRQVQEQRDMRSRPTMPSDRPGATPAAAQPVAPPVVPPIVDDSTEA
jgi:hypothetical protein